MKNSIVAENSPDPTMKSAKVVEAVRQKTEPVSRGSDALARQRFVAKVIAAVVVVVLLIVEQYRLCLMLPRRAMIFRIHGQSFAPFDVRGAWRQRRLL